MSSPPAPPAPWTRGGAASGRRNGREPSSSSTGRNLRWSLSNKHKLSKKDSKEKNGGMDTSEIHEDVLSIPATAKALDKVNNKENSFEPITEASQTNAKSAKLSLSKRSAASSHGQRSGRRESKEDGGAPFRNMNAPTAQTKQHQSSQPTTPAAMAASPTVYHQVERRREGLTSIPTDEDCGRADVLDLASNQIGSLQGIEQYKALRKAFLFNNKIEAVSKIEDNRLLEELYLQLNQIENITLRRNLSRLSTLRIDGNRIASVEFLRYMQSLKYLNISGNPLADIQAIGSLKNLRVLKASNCGISNVEAIVFCGNLEELDLDGNPITGLKKLSALKSLETLSLENCSLDDDTISQCQSCYSVSSLSLARNDLSSASMLPKLFPNVSELDIATNKIDCSDETSFLDQLAPLKALRSLRVDIDLSTNEAADIESKYRSYFPELLFLNEFELTVEAKSTKGEAEEEQEQDKGPEADSEIGIPANTEVPSEPPKIDQEEIKKLRQNIQETKSSLSSKVGQATEHLASSKPFRVPVHNFVKSETRKSEIEKLAKRVEDIRPSSSKSGDRPKSRRKKLGQTSPNIEADFENAVGNEQDVRNKLDRLREMRTRRLDLIDEAVRGDGASETAVSEYRQIAENEEESIRAIREQVAATQEKTSSRQSRHADEQDEATHGELLEDVNHHNFESKDELDNADTADEGIETEKATDGEVFEDVNHHNLESKDELDNADTAEGVPETENANNNASPILPTSTPATGRSEYEGEDVDSTVNRLMESVFREAAQMSHEGEASLDMKSSPEKKSRAPKNPSLSKYMKFATQLKHGSSHKSLNSSRTEEDAKLDNDDRPGSEPATARSSTEAQSTGPRSGVLAAALRYSRSSETVENTEGNPNSAESSSEDNPTLLRRPASASTTTSLPHKQLKEVRLFESKDSSELERPSSSGSTHKSIETPREQPISGKGQRPSSQHFGRRRQR